jgi:hypothetical protein
VQFNESAFLCATVIWIPTTMEQQLWQDALQNKRAQLSVAFENAQRRSKVAWFKKSLDDFVFVKSYEEFSASLKQICDAYQNSKFTRLVTTKIYPHLNHIRSLSNGITAATQADSSSALCWGALLLVLHVMNALKDLTMSVRP